MAIGFDSDFLKKLEYLHVVSKKAFAGQARADRLAPKRGRGLEFADTRPYSVGDDFRHIDWKAYRRLGRLLLRLFDEEQDLPIYLFIDASQSMAPAGQGAEKFEQALRVAAALCYIGLAHLDRVTIMPFDATVREERSCGQGKGRIFRVFEQLEEITPGGGTNMNESFKLFAAKGRRAGLAVVISDFLDPNGYESALKVLQARGHDVYVVQMASERDRDPGALGDVRFVDAENGDTRDIEVTPALAKAYTAAWQKHTDELETFCGRYNIGYVRADAERPVEEIILKTFRQGRFVA